jgi:hypothetical protein
VRAITVQVDGVLIVDGGREHLKEFDYGEPCVLCKRASRRGPVCVIAGMLPSAGVEQAQALQLQRSAPLRDRDLRGAFAFGT